MDECREEGSRLAWPGLSRAPWPPALRGASRGSTGEVAPSCIMSLFHPQSRASPAPALQGASMSRTMREDTQLWEQKLGDTGELLGAG